MGKILLDVVIGAALGLLFSLLMIKLDIPCHILGGLVIFVVVVLFLQSNREDLNNG